ncbi:MAG: NAD(P)/FAD-dependent oxidoreductase [Puia sp.]|nr:NAD(P)/FAD-dependent oxidoreductase [Puia sp.]
MKTAIIIGAGPAGLTAAYELLTKTDIRPILIEAEGQPGGLSKTVVYKGNRIDIGGHRFFSKSERVLNWWLHFLPIDASVKSSSIDIQYQHRRSGFTIDEEHKAAGAESMLVRPRKSRIYFRRKFFDYPLQLNARMIRNLGIPKMCKILASFTRTKLFPISPEENLAQFFINRFGRELYLTFFKDYTEKVWGVPCEKIPSDWGRQRVKNLDIAKMLKHALHSVFSSENANRKSTHTSLIEQFLYPKYGPGQMWETVAKEVERLGGRILYHTAATGLNGNDAHRILSVNLSNSITGETEELSADYFFSTMPVNDLVRQMRRVPIPEDVKEIATSLEYRDFLIVGILASGLALENDKGPLRDNWLYIQDKEVMAGRIQFFNNWSPFMVADSTKNWLGVEYFCNEPDPFWQLDDDSIKERAIREMEKIGILRREQVLDSTVVKVEKAYPSYYGAYSRFGRVREFLDKIENLYLIGRNGMHRYNNSDHSMLTAMTAVENIVSGRIDRSNIWEINIGDEYHEEK